MSAIAAGQVYRDTYYDKPRTRGANQKPSRRTIRVLAQEPDGRWLVQSVTDHAGAEVANGRKTRVSANTLATGYELVTAAAAT